MESYAALCVFNHFSNSLCSLLESMIQHSHSGRGYFFLLEETAMDGFSHSFLLLTVNPFTPFSELHTIYYQSSFHSAIIGIYHQFVLRQFLLRCIIPQFATDLLSPHSYFPQSRAICSSKCQCKEEFGSKSPC